MSSRARIAHFLGSPLIAGPRPHFGAPGSIQAAATWTLNIVHGEHCSL
jgi:hypothetical protein